MRSQFWRFEFQLSYHSKRPFRVTGHDKIVVRGFPMGASSCQWLEPQPADLSEIEIAYNASLWLQDFASVQLVFSSLKKCITRMTCRSAMLASTSGLSSPDEKLGTGIRPFKALWADHRHGESVGSNHHHKHPEAPSICP